PTSQDGEAFRDVAFDGPAHRRELHLQKLIAACTGKSRRAVALLFARLRLQTENLYAVRLREAIRVFFPLTHQAALQSFRSVSGIVVVRTITSIRAPSSRSAASSAAPCPFPPSSLSAAIHTLSMPDSAGKLATPP